MRRTSQLPIERYLDLEPTTVLLSSDTCLAYTTESGFLSVSWPPGGDPEEERLAAGGVLTAHAEGATRSWSLGATTSSLPVALIGDISLQTRPDGAAVVLQHICPETRHTVLGPWDEPTARALLLAVQGALGLPRKLGALLEPSQAELLEDPRRFHGALIAVEGRFARAFEAPSFVGRSNLIFPPGVTEPDRPTRVRAEGVWVLTDRPGILRFGGSFAELHARTVEAFPWASTVGADHRRVLGLPLPERLIDLIDRGAWNPSIMDETRLLNATGWARVLSDYLSPAEMEAETLALRALPAAERARLGLAVDMPRHLDDARALVIAKNEDGRMIALDYRLDPPEVVYVAEAHDIRGAMRWRRIAGDFDVFAEGLLPVFGR